MTPYICPLYSISDSSLLSSLHRQMNATKSISYEICPALVEVEHRRPLVLRNHISQLSPAVEYRTGSSVCIIVVLPLFAFLCQHPGFGTQERNMSSIQRAIINSLLKSHWICRSIYCLLDLGRQDCVNLNTAVWQ